MLTGFPFIKLRTNRPPATRPVASHFLIIPGLRYNGKNSLGTIVSGSGRYSVDTCPNFRKNKKVDQALIETDQNSTEGIREN